MMFALLIASVVFGYPDRIAALEAIRLPVFESMWIFNNSDKNMVEIRLRAQGERSWSSNVLDAPIGPHRKKSVDFRCIDPPDCWYDVRFYLADGTVSEVSAVWVYEAADVPWSWSITGTVDGKD